MIDLTNKIWIQKRLKALQWRRIKEQHDVKREKKLPIIKWINSILFEGWKACDTIISR